MNKIYMVKRNALGQSVVASELAKSKGKLSSVAKVVSLAVLGLASSAFAVTTNEITTYGQDATAQTGGTAIGVQAQADTNGTAIGQQATASTQATANGYVSAALANETIAIGVNSGAVGGSISKNDAETLKEIDNKITEYSKETPPVDPLTAVAPIEPIMIVETTGAPIQLKSNLVFPLPRDDFYGSLDISKLYSQIHLNNDVMLNEYPKVNGYRDDFRSYISNLLSLSTYNDMKNVTNNGALDNFNAITTQKQSVIDNYEATHITGREQRYSEIETSNPEIIALVKKYTENGGANFEYITNEDANVIAANQDLFVEAYNLFLEIDNYRFLKDQLTQTLNYTYNNLLYEYGLGATDPITAANNYYNEVSSKVATYETALAEYNAKVAAYDEAVKNREMTEAERVVKLEEVIKELNTKATELGLGESYANLSQVLGSLEGRAIAIGNQAYVSGDEAVGVGYGNTVLGSRSNVVGTHNNVTTANNNVMGNDNTVTVSEGNVLVGNNITFANGGTTGNNIALGTDTVISAPVPTASMDIRGTTYNFAGTTPTSVLSIASEDNERQIQNVAAGRVTSTSTDAINGSQLYAVTEALNVIQSINLDDIAAANINTQATVTAGQGITIAENDNANGTKNYTASAKLGEGLSFDENGAIRANGTTLHAGENVEITGDANGGYTINAKTQIINGGKATVVHAGDNVRVTGDVDNGFTVNVDNMRTTVTGGQGTEVTSSDNTDGSKNYTVNVKVGEGLTYDDKGNLVNDMKLTAGENVQISGDAKGGYTISATDTNTQATVSADKGITITETDNANGTKNYAVSAKLGKGLKVDENGAIAATTQPINGGAGVTITTNAQDEAVVNVAGVTTTTDDGKSYTRSDLTKSVGVKGDGKNIRTSTTANGDVQVKLADDVKVNSVAIHNGPTINQQGINANNTRITNVQDGVAPTDAVNVRQLNQQGNILNQRIDNLADNVKKNKKRNDAGIASTAAMANIPQVMLAGKSGVGVGVGHRSGQNAIAVGYSRASDNAKHIIKLSAGLDTQSKATFGAGYMYQW